MREGALHVHARALTLVQFNESHFVQAGGAKAVAHRELVVLGKDAFLAATHEQVAVRRHGRTCVQQRRADGGVHPQDGRLQVASAAVPGHAHVPLGVLGDLDAVDHPHGVAVAVDVALGILGKMVQFFTRRLYMVSIRYIN